MGRYKTSRPTTMKLLRAAILLCCILTFAEGHSQFTINDTFADPDECTYMTRGIFIVWWDNDFDYTVQVDALLDQIIGYREECINDLGMMDPPGVVDGYYQNIYLHGDGGFFDSNGWGNGVGTDSNGYPFYTMPYNLFNDPITIAHEMFHIFQYNANSPGFAYSGDSQWYIEASASWYGGRQDFSAERAFIEAESLVRLSQVPLWLSFDNYPASYPSNWNRYVHQYALDLLLFYLTEEAGVSHNVISEGFYMELDETPQEYLFNTVGATDYRTHFLDWVSRMTNEFDFITQTQRDANELEWLTYADPADDNEFIETFDSDGSNGWYEPADQYVTNAWSFNTYKLENSTNSPYTFQMDGAPTGNYGDAAHFQVKVLVKNSTTGTTFYDIPMTNHLQGSLTLNLTSEDTEALMVIASMPGVFEDNNFDFQLFPYRMRIENQVLGIDDFNRNTPEKMEIARYNILGQEINKTFDGIQIIRYSDGSTRRVLNY